MRKKINLQLFTTDLKSANTTTFKGKEPIAEAHAFADKNLVECIYDEYTFEKYCDTVRIPQNAGKTYTSRKSLPYVANINELQEGVVPDEDAPMGEVEFQVKLSNFGGWTSYTDEAEIYDIDNGVVARITSNQGGAVGEKLQEKLRDIFYSSPNRWFAGVSSVSATLAATRAGVTPIDLNDFKKIRTKLKRMKVKPYDGKYYYVLISPEIEQTLYDLKKTADNGTYSFLEMQGFNQGKLFDTADGSIGAFLGFKFIVEDVLGEIKDTSGNAVTNTGGFKIHGCVILGKYRQHKGVELVKLAGGGAPKTIIKEKGSAGTQDPLNQKGTVGWKMQGWGANVKYLEACMIYECASDMDIATEFDDKDRAAFIRGVTGARQTVSGTEQAVSISAGTNKTIKNGAKGVVFTDDTNVDGKVDPVTQGGNGGN